MTAVRLINIIALALLSIVASIPQAEAEAESTSRLFDSAAIFVGQGVDHNLREIPGQIIAGKIDWENTYFVALGLAKEMRTLGQAMDSLSGTFVAPVRLGYELDLVKHHGLQHNTEIGAAYTLRTPDWLIGPIGVNFGGGMGLSCAVGSPVYEDGPKGEPERQYRTQLLILYELEWSMKSGGNMTVVTRGHHRSGAYGLIAPRHVGSNFLTVGLRYAF